MRLRRALDLLCFSLMLLAMLLNSLISSSSASADFMDAHSEGHRQWVQQAVLPSPGELWMAIVGDSSVTGAAANPVYKARWLGLVGQLFGFLMESQFTEEMPQFNAYLTPDYFGITDPVEPMTRVLYSQAEFKARDAVDINLEAKGSIRVDTPEYAFGYMVGRKLGINPHHIVVTGQDGKRVNTMFKQFQRIFEVGAPTLPPLILMSYVANDFCHPNNFTRPVTEFQKEYEGDLRSQLDQILSLPPAPEGTKIVILAPLDVANLLSNPLVEAQRIPFEGGSEYVTCGQLRAGNDGDFFGQLMAKTLVGECRGVMEPSAHPVEHLQRVRDLQYAQVSTLAEQVVLFNARAPKGLRATLATSVRDIEFQTGDVAGDCFHPGVRGHARIARQLLDHELKSLVSP